MPRASDRRDPNQQNRWSLKSIASPTGKVEWGNFLRRSLSAREHEDAANYDRGDAENRCHQPAFLCRDLERPHFDLVTALRVRYSTHRHDDDARNDEKHSNPTQWPHDHSAKGIAYPAVLGVSLQGVEHRNLSGASFSPVVTPNWLPSENVLVMPREKL
jgi:hypothetical protein